MRFFYKEFRIELITYLLVFKLRVNKYYKMKNDKRKQNKT